jgi:hypothetical protein
MHTDILHSMDLKCADWHQDKNVLTGTEIKMQSVTRQAMYIDT